MNEQILERIAIALEKIAIALEKMETTNPDAGAPNYKADIDNFLSYNWESIGAEIEKIDSDGVATVLWRGNRYVRRSPDNAYKPVIFFSRCIGKDDSGKNCYERLITFEQVSEIEVSPISRKVERLLR